MSILHRFWAPFWSNFGDIFWTPAFCDFDDPYDAKPSFSRVRGCPFWYFFGDFFGAGLRTAFFIVFDYFLVAFWHPLGSKMQKNGGPKNSQKKVLKNVRKSCDSRRPTPCGPLKELKEPSRMADGRPTRP